MKNNLLHSKEFQFSFYDISSRYKVRSVSANILISVQKQWKIYKNIEIFSQNQTTNKTTTKRYREGRSCLMVKRAIARPVRTRFYFSHLWRLLDLVFITKFSRKFFKMFNFFAKKQLCVKSSLCIFPIFCSQQLARPISNSWLRPCRDRSNSRIEIFL